MRSNAARVLTRSLLALASLSVVELAWGQDDFERPPVSYSTSPADNDVTRLQEKLDRGEASLTFDRKFGYLKGLLAALQIPVESQCLVYSKTSLQIRRISPRTPRALYFNDDLYVGYCQNGDVLEISAVDPRLGAVFYTLDQRPGESAPKFERRTDNCLVCHASSRTDGVPGHLVRSLLVESSGHPVLSAGSRTVNHTTPIEDRWGGWYVTGEHGAQKHLGNLIVTDGTRPSDVDNAAGHNVMSLSDRFDTSRYLCGHSDIVALMVLEHQTLVHNRITSANFSTRQALEYDAMLNRLMENKETGRLESTTRRIHNAGDKLVEALLMVDEARLTEPIRGTSGFAKTFADHGPRDRQGRSLRDLDLTRRMFKFPCSYLIYSEAFTQLPNDVREYAWQRIGDVLSGRDQSKKFEHLSAADRQALLEILTETVPNLPESWPRK